MSTLEKIQHNLPRLSEEHLQKVLWLTDQLSQEPQPQDIEAWYATYCRRMEQGEQETPQDVFYHSLYTRYAQSKAAPGAGMPSQEVEQQLAQKYGLSLP